MKDLNASTYIQGNLALSMPAPEEQARPRVSVLEVIDGGLNAAPTAVNRPSFRLTPRIVAPIAVIVLIAAIVVGTLVANRVAYDAAVSSIRLERTVVAAGDSLWGIARDHRVPGMSDAEMVDYLINENGLAGQVLQPGQEILVARAR